jgi:hypothetical protein
MFGWYGDLDVSDYHSPHFSHKLYLTLAHNKAPRKAIQSRSVRFVVPTLSVFNEISHSLRILFSHFTFEDNK